MKLHLMSYKNILTECFTQPKVIDTEPEKAGVAIARDLTMLYYNPKTRNQVMDYENLILYHIGEFDDQTGLIVPVAPTMVINLFDVVQQIKLRFKDKIEKESAEDVKDTKPNPIEN